MQMRFECELTWEQLDGEDDVRRHCAECDRGVYNLSGMTRKQAVRLFARHDDDIPCVRFVSRDGRIVHNGDPLEQLRAQRFGARKLLAGAVALQVVFVAFTDDPSQHWYDPFGALTALFGSSCSVTTTGVPAPRDDSPFHGVEREPDCETTPECVAAAEASYARANRHAREEDPASAYREYHALDEANRALIQGGYDRPPEPMADIETRMLELESKLDETVVRFRIESHLLNKRKQFSERARVIREWKGHFPDPDSTWGREAYEQERRMKDAGEWPH